jgi:TRAP-type transport system small permease protein
MQGYPPRLLAPLRHADALLVQAMRWFLVATMALMTVIVFGQVVLRYGFNSAIDWADEASRLSFVWCVFIAIPLAVRERLHLGMEILVERLPLAWRPSLARVMDAVAAGMMILVCWQSLVLAHDQWDEKMATMNASAAWFVVAVAVGCGLSAYELLRLLVRGQEPVAKVVME